MKLSHLANLLALFVVLALAVVAFADVPKTINYQGYLKNTDGTPVNVTTNITFRLYSSNSPASAELWSESHSITPTNGIYNVDLSSFGALPFNKPYFLGITVARDSEMSPRQPLTSVPYALYAIETGSVADGIVTMAKLADGAVTDPKISGVISGSKLGSHIHSGNDLISGTVGDARLSANVDLLNANQTITGVKNFNTAGSFPFTVAATGTGLVTNLNAEMIGGRKLADLDLRYGQRTVVQLPRTNTITTLDSTGNVGEYTSITVGSDGLPLISYYDIGNGDLKVAHCSNASCTAASITTLDSIGNVGAYTSIATGMDGLPIIAYYDVTNGDLKVAHCSNTACTAAVITTLDSAGNVGDSSSLAIGVDGLAVISYHSDQSGGKLKVAHCNNTLCTSATTTIADSYTDTGTVSTSIAVGADGLPVISCYHPYGNTPHVDHCEDIACTSTTINLISAEDSSGYSSITVGADGLPIVSLMNFYTLVALHCDNIACSAYTTTILDNIGLGNNFTSITVGADGLPIISYKDHTNADLKVAHCANFACTSATTAVMDSIGDVGGHSSITAGADGLPVIAYYDSTNGDLKVVKCTNQFCLNNWTRR